MKIEQVNQADRVALALYTAAYSGRYAL